MGRSSARHEKIRTQAQTCIAFGFLISLAHLPLAGATTIRVRVGESAQSPVRTLDLEEYLVGVVGLEMNAKEFPDAALEAQAITARTYALTKRQEASREGRDFDLQSTVLDQVYDPNAALHARARAAVEKTRGQVLADEKSKKIFVPYYHSTCGGATERPDRVWGIGTVSGGRYTARLCAFCKGSPRAQWESAVGDGVIAQKLGLPSAAHVVRWVLKRDGPGQRIRSLSAYTDQGQEIIKTGQKWRATLGFDILRSLLLEQPERAPARDAWIFRGRGAGHGVGMCQWGARGAAQQGWSAQRILKHYYPFAQVTSAN